MTVNRKEEGSIEIRSEDGSVRAISVMRAVHDGTDNAAYHAWLDECALLVSADPHSFLEMEQYFLDRCDTVVIPPEDRRINTFLINVVMNFRKDKLTTKVPDFSFDMTDEEIEQWHELEMAMRQEIQHSTPERFGLIIRGYSLPRNERNAVHYAQADQKLAEEIERRNRISAARPGFQAITMERMHWEDITVFFEETTGQCNVNGGECDLFPQMVEYRGVTREDIETRSPRYMMYVFTLQKIGKLPPTPHYQT